jgi:type IV secretion system protein VirB5
MKTVNKVIGTVLIIISLCGSNNALAVDIVTDITPTTIAGWAAQAGSWAKQLQGMQNQYSQLQSTYSQIKTTYDSMNGNRGMGAVLPLANSMRNYMPQGASDMVGVLNNTNNGYSGMGSQIQALVSNNAILSNASLTNMNMTPAQAQLLTDRRTNAAAIQSIASQGMANASARFNYLQSLMDQINTTTDPKAIAELNARIEAEQIMMTNEQTKLQQIVSFMQSRDAITQQQQNELAIQQTGSTKNLTQPNYGITN